MVRSGARSRCSGGRVATQPPQAPWTDHVGRPYAGATAVVVTGTFDNWAKTIRLEKTADDDYFSKRVELVLGGKILYKVR
jgi:hypothetical protein